MRRLHPNSNRRRGLITVSCTECGSENDENARYCVQCGASLRSSTVRYEGRRTSQRDACFGYTRPVRYFWLLVGLVIILWGVTDLLRIYFQIRIEMWPFILIAIGIYIIYRASMRYRRGYDAWPEVENVHPEARLMG